MISFCLFGSTIQIQEWIVKTQNEFNNKSRDASQFNPDLLIYWFIDFIFLDRFLRVYEGSVYESLPV